MPSLSERVLEALHLAGRPLGASRLEETLRLDDAGRGAFASTLADLIAAGEVIEVRGSRVGLPAHMNLVAGRLTCNPAGFGFVAPERRRPGQQDVYVSALNIKEALHGDRVVVRIERTTAKGSEGRIIRVLERRLLRLVGRYEDDGPWGGRVVPFDARVLHEVLVPRADSAGADSGVMVVVEIVRPPSATRNPTGRVIGVLGRLDEPGVDVKVVMAKHELPETFPPEVEAEAGRVPTTVRPEDVVDRSDFRPWATVTVDPESARDHDDAISLDRLPNGHWLLAVHIADVAHYVREGSPIDQEAYLRGTSVYFPDRVVPMLPHALSSRICSLIEAEDRLTQTVLIELDSRGRVVRSEFRDGVIRSAARMSYSQVQAIVDGDQALRAAYAPLVPLFQRMDELAKLMRKRRHERGSLDLDLPEPKLVLDAAGAITGIVATERLDSMRMIEEFMLAANEAVAEALSESGIGTLYRIHEPPDPGRVEEFCDLVASLGYRVPTNLESVRPEDFQQLARQIRGKPEEKLVSYLLLRTMKLARYHEENLGHFGLATGMYAHFTSPIRRYPDLVAHRALRRLRQSSAEPEAEREAELKQRLPAMAEHLSLREQRAAEAERELLEWKKIRFMADKVGETFGGFVTGVQAFGLFIELTDIYVQGLVHVSSMTDDYYSFDEKAHLLRGENTRAVYRLGDRVEVQVAKVDLERRRMDLVLVDVVARAGVRRERGGRGAAASGPRGRHARSGRPAGRTRPPRRRG